jgi:hypothetical protein
VEGNKAMPFESSHKDGDVAVERRDDGVTA